MIRGILTTGEKSGNKIAPEQHKSTEQTAKKQFFHINHRECKRHLRPVSKKNVLGIKLLQVLVVGMSLPPDGKSKPLGRVLVKYAANLSQGRGWPKMPWTPTSQEWGKSGHGSHAQLLHLVPYLSNQWVWRWISPKEALCCCENAQVYAQESSLEKLPSHCKGSFQDQYHQVSGLREKYLLVDSSAPLRRIIYDASPSRL